MTYMGEERNECRILMGKPEGKRLIERIFFNSENNIKMYVKGIGWANIDWVDLFQDTDKQPTFVNAGMNLRRDSARLAEKLKASQVGICSIVLVS